MSVEEKLIERIRKLFAKAENTDSQAEAETFIAKANELLLKHKLDVSSVEEQESEYLEDKAFEFGSNKSEGNTWEFSLASVIARHNLCTVLAYSETRKKGGTISVIGEKQNVEIVKYLFEVARRVIRHNSKTKYQVYRRETLDLLGNDLTEKEWLRGGQLAYPTVWRRNYLKGSVIGLDKKLHEERERFQKDMNETESNQFGLMIIDERNKLKAFVKEQHGNLKSKTSGTIGDALAFKQGVRDGKKISLNKGVDGVKNKAPKRLN